MVVLYAAVAAFLFAAGSVTAKRGMQHTSALTALIVSSTVAALMLGGATGFDPPDSFVLSSVLFFAGAGVIGDGVGRFSMLGAVDRLGPSLAIPIQTAAYPLVAVLAGVVILSETVTPAQILGVVTVIAGIWVLLLPARSGATASPDSAKVARRTYPWSALALPALAGVGFASSDVLRKSGLEETPNPAFGALIAVGTMLVLVSVTAFSIPGLRRQIRLGPGWSWLMLAGACIAGALLAVFKALETGEVSTVGPIIAAQPLAIIILSWALLHNIERVSLRMVVGAILVVAGVVGIAVGA
jgi:drug/metabolite transporter (DMT)-like permease